jgi:hypothetical protein
MEFFCKYNGLNVRKDPKWGYQCVGVFRQFCDDVLRIGQPSGVVGAINFWDNRTTDAVLRNNFTAIPNTPTFLPHVGDVCIFDKTNSNPNGHISIATGSADLKLLVTFDQNYPTVAHPCAFTFHGYTGLVGVLRFKGFE